MLLTVIYGDLVPDVVIVGGIVVGTVETVVGHKTAINIKENKFNIVLFIY